MGKRIERLWISSAEQTFEDCYWAMTNDRSKAACKIHPKTQRQSASSFGKESGRREARRPLMGSGESQGNSRPGGSKLWRQSGFFLEVERILRGALTRGYANLQ